MAYFSGLEKTEVHVASRRLMNYYNVFGNMVVGSCNHRKFLGVKSLVANSILMV